MLRYMHCTGCKGNKYHPFKGAMGEISNFYNFSPRMLVFGTHITPIITIHAVKFH